MQFVCKEVWSQMPTACKNSTLAGGSASFNTVYSLEDRRKLSISMRILRGRIGLQCSLVSPGQLSFQLRAWNVPLVCSNQEGIRDCRHFFEEASVSSKTTCGCCSHNKLRADILLYPPSRSHLKTKKITLETWSTEKGVKFHLILPFWTLSHIDSTPDSRSHASSHPPPRQPGSWATRMDSFWVYIFQYYS